MQQNNDEQLDKLIKKIMKDIAPEAPSTDFTANLMEHVHAVNPAKTIVYHPPISKTGWFFIAALVLGLFMYILLNAKTSNLTQLTPFNFNALYQKMQGNLSGLNFSMISLYAVALTTILFFVQIHFLMGRYYKEREA